MLKEFKEFAMRGNVLDLAIGVVIGAAFGKIVSSLVADIITPILSLFTGRVDFTNLFVSLSEKHFATLKEAKDAGVATINYGSFLQSIFDFIIVAFAIFLLVRQVNKLQRQPEAAPAAPTKECPHCLYTVPLAATRCAHCTSDLKAA